MSFKIPQNRNIQGISPQTVSTAGDASSLVELSSKVSETSLSILTGELSPQESRESEGVLAFKECYPTIKQLSILNDQRNELVIGGRDRDPEKRKKIERQIELKSQVLLAKKDRLSVSEKRTFAALMQAHETVYPIFTKVDDFREEFQILKKGMSRKARESIKPENRKIDENYRSSRMEKLTKMESEEISKIKPDSVEFEVFQILDSIASEEKKVKKGRDRDLLRESWPKPAEVRPVSVKESSAIADVEEKDSTSSETSSLSDRMGKFGRDLWSGKFSPFKNAVGPDLSDKNILSMSPALQVKTKPQ